MSGYGSGKPLLTNLTENSLTYANDLNKQINALLKSIPQEMQATFNQGLQYLTNGSFDAASGKLDPFVTGGQAAMNKALALQGIGPNAMTGAQVNQELQNMPGFQFQMTQGQKAVQAANSAKGLNGSGAMMKDLTEYGQGLASQQFGQYQSQLAQLANIGAQTGTAQLNATNTNNTAAASLLGQLGTQQAQAQIQLQQQRSSAYAGVLNTREHQTEQGSVMKRLENAAG